MKYINLFKTAAEYEQAGELSRPQLALVKDQMKIHSLSKQPNNEIWYTSSDGNIVTPYNTRLFGANIVSNTYADGKGVIKFDADVTSIGNNAFKNCKNLISINIPDSVTSIGESAFISCSSLTHINIPDSVTSIRQMAFKSCSSLTSITIPDSVTSIEYSVFSWCSSLTSITIPDSVTSIGVQAFNMCSKLTSITIPDSVTSIGDQAFSGCSKLTSITIPDLVSSIRASAFLMSSLTSITVSSGNIVYDSRGNCNAIIETASNTLIVGCKNTVIPNSVTSIGAEAFRCCSGMASINIPDSVTSIGNYTFGDCTSLTSITIGNSVTSIGQYAFQNCSGLTSITIPDSVTSIGQYAFQSCSGLTSITIPDSVTSIEQYAFQRCSGLTSITVSSDNTVYDSKNNCNAIIETASNTLIAGCKNTVIPDSVTSIGNAAFQNCSGLTNITIPNSVTSIGYSAFICSKLTSITLFSTIPPTIQYNTFESVPATCPIYVPASSVDAYKAANNWAKLAAQIQAKPE